MEKETVILMGDFNSRLPRNTDHHVGKWCIHNRMDKGGKRLLDIMAKMSLRCVSTYFQPPQKRTNATFQNVQPSKAPSQIDYILVSSRWSSAVRDCKTKWGISISAYGRKYDHALISAKFQIHLKCDRRSKRKDYKALKQPEVSQAHHETITTNLNSTDRPAEVSDQFKRLTEIMTSAQEAIPNVSRQSSHKWKTSDATSALIAERANNWDNLNAEQRKTANKNISISARDDYRSYVNGVLEEIEEAESAGKSSDIFKLARQLSTKRNGNQYTQPVLDDSGNPITTTEQQHELWANFLENKFAALPDEPKGDLTDPPDTSAPMNITLVEVKECVKLLKSGKATGPDLVPVEQYKASEDATAELFHLLLNIWDSETMPNDFVFADMLLYYKKKSKNDHSNYRALGLLNHAYKIFSMLLLLHILPFITPKLSDMQAGFRKGRGCRDNITILVMTVSHLLKSAEKDAVQGIIPYIDFTAAFAYISHSYLIGELKEY